jgi:hypothetical protein
MEAGELIALLGFVPASDVAVRSVDLAVAVSLSGESDLLSMINGGGTARRTRPAT